MSREFVSRTFSSLTVRNFRLYVSGQLVSQSGTWMQTVGQALLVLQLTGKGTALGAVTAMQYLPILLLAPLGGVVADRFDKRTILFCTQATSAVLALLLGVLVATDAVQLWMVYVLAAALGTTNAIDSPARQTFVFDLVGPDDLTNAVSLHTATVNLARVIGPSLGALFVATVGLAWCFFYNAASFVAVLIALALMHSTEFRSAPTVARTKGQLREGLRYVRRTPGILAPILIMVVVGLFAWEFQVTLPLFAEFTFHGGATAYGVMAALMGVGAIAGALVVANRARGTGRSLVLATIGFGIALLVTAVVPTLAIALVMMVPLGALAFAFIALGNSTVQLTTRPEMRGRVMAIWIVAAVGTTPIGAPLVGWIGDAIGPRYGLAVGGIATLLAGILAYPTLGARSERPMATAPEPDGDEITASLPSVVAPPSTLPDRAG
jgi:MFS family permease